MISRVICPRYLPISLGHVANHQTCRLITANNQITYHHIFGCPSKNSHGHRKDKERVEKATEILLRFHYPKKEEGEVKADPSIVVTATSAAPKEEKASNSATLWPKREVVYVSLSPVKAQKKWKDGTPSPSFAKMMIDLTAEEVCHLPVDTIE